MFSHVAEKMVIDETGIQKKFLRFLLVQSIAALVLLSSAYYAEVLLQPLILLSLAMCIGIQFNLMNHPAYGIINLAYLSTSGVLFYFFAESGFPPNFIFFGIVGIFMINKIKLREVPVVIILLMLLFAYTNSIFNAYTAYASNADSSSILNILFPVTLFIFVISTLKKSNQVHHMYIALFWALFISSTEYLLAYVNGPLSANLEIEETNTDVYTKVSGISNHVNQLAAFIAFITPVILVEIQKITSSWQKKYYYILLGGLLILLLFMSSRAAIAMVVLYVSYKLVFSGNFSRTVKVAILSMFVGAYFAAIAFELPITQKLQVQKDSGDEIRVSKIDEALTVLSENPFLGIGLNNYVKYAAQHFNSSFNTHNTLLSVSAEQGIVGIVLFLLLYITPFLNFRLFRHIYTPAQRLLNMAVVESCALIFLAFFTDHLQGNAVYYILIATAIRSTLPLSNEQTW